MFPCSDESHAKRKMQEYCMDNDDVYILKSTTSRYKKIQSVIITSEEFEFIASHKGFVYIGMFYSEGFTNSSNCKSSALEVWPPIDSDVLQYLYAVQNCTINLSDCAVSIGQSIAPWFDAYFCGSLDDRYDIVIPASKYTNLHHFVQARLELLFLCNHSNDVKNKLKEGDELLHSLLDMRTKQFVFYDLVSFELLTHAVHHNRVQIESQFKHFFHVWKTMELKLLKLRIIFNFINYKTCDLRTITNDFLVKQNDGSYSYKKEDVHLLDRDDSAYLDKIISQKEEKERDTLSLFEAVAFAHNMCNNRISYAIDVCSSNSRSNNNPFLDTFSNQSIFHGQLFNKPTGELMCKVFELIKKYMTERVTILIGNIIKTYDLNEVKEDDADQERSKTRLIPKNLVVSNQVSEIVPKCIANIIKADDGYSNSFIFQFAEVNHIDIEDIVQDRANWRNALNRQKMYVAKTGREPFMPPCGWMMSSGLCPHLNVPHDTIKEEKQEVEVNIYKRRKSTQEKINISKQQWRDTMVKCKSDRNRNYRNPDDSFHQSPADYISRRASFAKHLTKYIDKKAVKFQSVVNKK